MALKKIIAAHRDQDGNWVDQQEVDMHPLEEAEITAHWAVGNHLILKPQELTDTEKLDLIVSQGQSTVQSLVTKYNQDLAAWQADHAPLIDAHAAASDAYIQYMNSL